MLLFESYDSSENSATMNELRPYVLELEQQIQTQRLSRTQWTEWSDVSLNNGAALELRRAADLRTQKTQGAFFTSASLADRAVAALDTSVRDSHRYFDPTCGAGDLLLAIARRMNLAATVPDTLSLWANRLIGCDISSMFVRATRARLALLAMQRVGCRESFTSQELAELLPSINVADIRDCANLYAQSDRIIMNPPYTLANVSEEYVWSTGLTNTAACFAADAIAHCKGGARIVAILPDVLRSGTRYERWRHMVGELTLVDHVESCGLFDKNADVDVFLLGVTVGLNDGSVQWRKDFEVRDRVSDRFDINVGSVVPYRDREEGHEAPYVDVRALSPWSTKLRIAETRRFEGRLFRLPFVAVRRTSSPRDRKRAVATVVLGKGEVAVENHIIVCTPHDGSIESCQQLVARLMDRRTDAWLNERIRCRHLTLGAVGTLPWWLGTEPKLVLAACGRSSH